jgi:hypothetical protein
MRRYSYGMVQIAARASLIVVLLLPTSPCTAFAVCAWLLWVGGDEVWIREDAFDGRAACVRWLDTWQRDHRDNTVRGSETVLVFASGTKYVCLPDTVDPRGPKGK